MAKKSKAPVDDGGVPGWMVSFGDMITLLLTFFILLVALADRQQSGLVGAGQGPLIAHIMAKGKPGILQGRLVEHRQRYKRDMWWVPSQEGDPDQLERVRQKLERELPTRFKPHEASIHYDRDQLVLRLPARIEYDGRPRLSAPVLATLEAVAEELRADNGLLGRINGDVPAFGRLELELRDSIVQARMIRDALVARGVPPRQLMIWGWGASRSISTENRSDSINRGVTIDLVRVTEQQ